MWAFVSRQAVRIQPRGDRRMVAEEYEEEMTRDPWKLVTSVDELRDGMTVELRPCVTSGRNERVVLLRSDDEPGVCGGCMLKPTSPFDWVSAGWSDDTLSDVLCAKGAIQDRRLYALIDDDTAADETTVTRRREMVE